MDCQQASVLMMEFLDGTISKTDRLKLQKHIDKCHSCRQEFSLLQESINLIDSLEEIEPPEELEQLVMSEINTHKYKKESKAITWILRIIVVSSMILGILAYLVFNNPVILEKTMVPVLIKFVNFVALTLPGILELLQRNFVLILGIGVGILSTLIISILMLVITEYYIVEKLKVNIKGGVKS